MVKGPIKIKRGWSGSGGGGFVAKYEGGSEEENKDNIWDKSFVGSGGTEAEGIQKPWDTGRIPGEMEPEEEDEDDRPKYDKNFVISGSEKDIDKDRGNIGTRKLMRQVLVFVVILIVFSIAVALLAKPYTVTKKKLFMEYKIMKSSNAEWHLERGLSALESGNPIKARNDFMRASRLRKNYAAAEHGMALYYIKTKGSAKRTQKHLNAAIRLEKKPLFLMTRGNWYVSRENFKDAIEDFTECIKLAAKDPEGYFARGKVYKRQGKYSKAIEDFKKAAQVDPKAKDESNKLLAQSHFEMAYIARKKDRLNEAMQHLKKALGYYPKHRESQKELSRFYYLKALRLRKAGKTKFAIKYLDNSVKVQPDFEKAFFARGSMLLSLGERENAVKDFRRAYELEPTNSKYFRILINSAMSLGNLMEKSDKTNEAIKAYSTIIDVDPKNSKALLRRGLLYLKSKDYSNATEDISGAIDENRSYRRYNSKLREAYIGLGYIQLEKTEYKEAEDAFTKALAIARSDHRALVGRAIARYKLDNTSQGDRDIKKAEKLRPNDPFVIMGRGRIYLEMNRTGDAIKLFNRVIKMDPKSWQAYYFRGKAYERKKSFQKAKSDWKKITDEAPKANYWHQKANESIEGLPKK